LLSSIVVSFGFAVSGARQTRNSQGESGVEERQFVNTVPEHVPLKVKLKSEKSFKDLKNKNWARELEVEVKNTGAKPIYYVHVEIVMPEININGGVLILSTAYGRKELAFPEEPVERNDIPILPGESITLTIPEGRVKAYEDFRDKERKYDDPKRIELEVQAVKFGDGTYLMGRKGELIRASPKKRASGGPRPKGEPGGCKPGSAVTNAGLTGGLFKASYSVQPASLLRAFLLRPDDTSALTAASSPVECNCQNSVSCKWGYLNDPSCPCDDNSEFPNVSYGGGCANPGLCYAIVIKTTACDTEYNGRQFCTYDEPSGTCTGGEPTPTPTPEQTPTPTPTPSGTPTPVGQPPNTTNCYWGPSPGTNIWGWQCFCLEGTPANYGANDSSGCPVGSYNNGDDCCINYEPCVAFYGSQEAYDAEFRNCMSLDGGFWQPYPVCQCTDRSPVLVDVLGDGFALTAPPGGVLFDIDGDGGAEHLS
jgi:hypothetical protein